MRSPSFPKEEVGRNGQTWEIVGKNASWLIDAFDHKFAKVGTYRVHCSEMPHLIGTVLVTPHHAATPDNRGDFSFDEVPAGSYKLRVWYADKWIHSQPVTIRGKTSVQVQIAAQQKE